MVFKGSLEKPCLLMVFRAPLMKWSEFDGARCLKFRSGLGASSRRPITKSQSSPEPGVGSGAG
eukprot:13649989-Alexandrium_andersonii.AAC.1